MIADEVLNGSTELLGDLQDESFGLIELDEFGRVSGIDEVLQFAALHELMPAH